MASTVRHMKFEATGDDLIMTRMLDAPRNLVFKARTDPERMPQRWGPHGMANPVCRLDARPGGIWHIVMRSPGGVDFPLKGVYIEAAEPERIVCTAHWEGHPADRQELLRSSLPSGAGGPGGEAVWTGIFGGRGGRIRLVIRNHFASAADRDAMPKTGMPDGWTRSLERLEALVEEAFKAAS